MTDAAPDNAAPKRRWHDTLGLMMLGSAFIFPPLILVGAAMIWKSSYWSRNEKIFSTVVPLSLLVIGILSGATADGLSGLYSLYVGAFMAGLLAAVIAAFTLAFRSGRRESRIRAAAH